MLDIDTKNIIGKIGKVKTFTNLTPQNLKDFSIAIKVVQEFNDNIEKYATSIFKDKFIDSIENWKNRLSPMDLEKSNIDSYEASEYCVFCYVNKRFFIFMDIATGWHMGARRDMQTRYSFDKKLNLKVVLSWETQSSRFEHIPWIPKQKTFTININSGHVMMYGDSMNDY